MSRPRSKPEPGSTPFETTAAKDMQPCDGLAFRVQDRTKDHQRGRGSTRGRARLLRRDEAARALIASAVGLAYIGWSEWYNVYRAENWQYMPAMPLLFGVGLSPLLQWVFVPAVTLPVVRRYAR